MHGVGWLHEKPDAGEVHGMWKGKQPVRELELVRVCIADRSCAIQCLHLTLACRAMAESEVEQPALLQAHKRTDEEEAHAGRAGSAQCVQGGGGGAGLCSSRWPCCRIWGKKGHEDSICVALDRFVLRGQ